jgi:hypothetical protein
LTLKIEAEAKAKAKPQRTGYNASVSTSWRKLWYITG